jgi:hypothetical protein
MRPGLRKNSVWPRLDPNNPYGKHSQESRSTMSQHRLCTPPIALLSGLHSPDSSNHFSADFLRLTIAAIQVGANGLVQPFDAG